MTREWAQSRNCAAVGDVLLRKEQDWKGVTHGVLNYSLRADFDFFISNVIVQLYLMCMNQIAKYFLCAGNEFSSTALARERCKIKDWVLRDFIVNDICLLCDFVDNCGSMCGIQRNIFAANARIILNSEKMRGRDLRNKLLRRERVPRAYPNFSVWCMNFIERKMFLSHEWPATLIKKY